jgi:hypothetical protein
LRELFGAVLVLSLGLRQFFGAGGGVRLGGRLALGGRADLRLDLGGEAAGQRTQFRPSGLLLFALFPRGALDRLTRVGQGRRSGLGLDFRCRHCTGRALRHV